MTDRWPVSDHCPVPPRASGKADTFAAHKHRDHRRKYTDDPYICHPRNVRLLVLGTPGCSQAMLDACLLHDTVEDTDTTFEELEEHFGPETTDLVRWMTQVSVPEDGNRAVRKEKDRQHLARAPAEAQTIKLADLIDNARSIRDHDPKFWLVYRREALALLAVLTRGDPDLRTMLTGILED